MQHVPVSTHTRRSWLIEKYHRYSWNLLFRLIRTTITTYLSNSMTSSPCRTFGRYITRNPFIDENPNCPTAMLCPISYYIIFVRAICISLYIPIICCFIFEQYFHSVLCDKLYEIPTGVEKENGTELLYENKFLFRPRVRQVL